MKHLKILLIACATILSLGVQTGAFAVTYPVSKTELVNVAQNKPVQSSKAEQHTIEAYSVSNLVDGDRATSTLSEFGPDQAGEEYFTIDLLKRCCIQKIEVFDSYDTDVAAGRENFEILGADSADFSDAVKLATMGSANETLFPHQGAFTVSLDGSKAYRYIRLKNTASGDYRLAEIKVWANLTVTDVARNLKEDRIITDALNDKSHWIYDFAPPTAAFDGDTSTFWLEDGSAYRYMRADLGKAYHIGMIEMTPRDMSADESIGDIYGKKYIKMYGSNTDAVDSSIFDPNSEPPSDSDALDLGFKKLFCIGADNPIDGEVMFPSLWIPKGGEAEYGKAGKFKATVDDTKAYRYFTYKHYMSLGASLSTFSLYVVHPDVNSVNNEDGRTICVNFSDEMEPTSLIPDDLVVKVNGGQVQYNVNWADDYTLEIQLDKVYFNSKVSVVLPKELCNKKDVSLVKDTELTLFTPSSLEVVEFKLQDKKDELGNEITSLDGLTEAGAYVKLKNNKSEGSESAIILTVLYDENNTIVKANEKRVSVEAQDEMSVFCGMEIENGENMRLGTYVWKDYDNMDSVIRRKITE